MQDQQQFMKQVDINIYNIFVNLKNPVTNLNIFKFYQNSSSGFTVKLKH